MIQIPPTDGGKVEAIQDLLESWKEGTLGTGETICAVFRIANNGVKGTYAFTPVFHPLGGERYVIGQANIGVKGYTPRFELGTYPTHDKANKRAVELNKELGLEPKEAWLIVATTMR